MGTVAGYSSFLTEGTCGSVSEELCSAAVVYHRNCDAAHGCPCTENRWLRGYGDEIGKEEKAFVDMDRHLHPGDACRHSKAGRKTLLAGAGRSKSGKSAFQNRRTDSR